MITEFVRRRVASVREWEPSHGGPLVDVGAMLLRKSQERENERDERRARPRELTGRALLAAGTYLFMRELFAAAETVGYMRGARESTEARTASAAPEAFWRGRHAGWTEAAAHWGLPLPEGVNAYQDGVPDDSFPVFGVVDSRGVPMSPFTHGGEGHGRYVVIGGRRFLADACECVDSPPDSGELLRHVAVGTVVAAAYNRWKVPAQRRAAGETAAPDE